LLSHALTWLAAATGRGMHVLVGHRADDVRAACAAREFVRCTTQHPPYTLGGALHRLRELAQDQPDASWLVVHADNFIRHPPVDLQASPGTDMLVWQTAEDVTGGLANTPCYRLTGRCLEVVEPDLEGLPDFVESLRTCGLRVQSARLSGWRRNVNTLTDLLEVQRRLLEDWTASDDAPAGFSAGARVWVSPTASVTRATLGPYVSVGHAATVRDCRLADVAVAPHATAVGLELRRGVIIGDMAYQDSVDIAMHRRSASMFSRRLP
jgi:NDP-sugar pyrophosphorylase family protein